MGTTLPNPRRDCFLVPLHFGALAHRRAVPFGLLPGRHARRLRPPLRGAQALRLLHAPIEGTEAFELLGLDYLPQFFHRSVHSPNSSAFALRKLGAFEVARFRSQIRRICHRRLFVAWRDG